MESTGAEEKPGTSAESVTLTEMVNNHQSSAIVISILASLAKGSSKADLSPISNLIYLLINNTSPTIKSIIWNYHREQPITSVIRALKGTQPSATLFVTRIVGLLRV
eukprot:sb/3477712/